MGDFIWTIWKIWIVQGINISIVSGGSEGRVSFLLSSYQKELLSIRQTFLKLAKMVDCWQSISTPGEDGIRSRTVGRVENSVPSKDMWLTAWF